jgi:hypothetical protein
MTNSSHACRDRLLEQLLGFVWRQWTTLGVPGDRASSGDWIIDPEALVLITTEIGRHDSRLLDTAIDWLLTHGQSINLQRLRRLQGQWGPCDERVLSGIAEILAERSVLRKWRTLCETVRFREPAEALFLAPDGSGIPVFGDPDPRFEKYGLLRSRWESRSNAQAPSPQRPGNLLLTLRSLFGVTARAEIMAWLLTHEEGHPAAISKSTAYFAKSIQATLNEMEASGQIRSERHGREKYFRLHRDDWRFLITWPEPSGFPRWISWPPVFYFAFRTLQMLGETGASDTSDRLRAIQQRGFLDEVAPALREGRLRSRLSAHQDLKGVQLTEAILRDAAELGQLLESDFPRDSTAVP